MLVISAGMPKSGSGYFYNVLNDILIESGYPDARRVKQDYHLENIMRWHNNNVGDLPLKKLMKLWLISVRAGSFCVKSHMAPEPAVVPIMKTGLVRAIYIYRDPRDAVLSVIDHGRKLLAQGKYHTFAKKADFDSAFRAVPAWFKIWSRYKELPGTKMLRYEQLMQDPFAVVRDVAEFLKIDPGEPKAREILWRYSRFNSSGKRKGLHYNKAVVSRYTREMSPEQKRRFNHEFGAILKTMQYPLH
jgi:hypothetical protein